MKKSTQKMLMAISIVFIFGLSSIAFVFSGFGGEQQNELKPLDTFIVEGEIDPRLEDAYIRGGFTFLKLFYNDTIDKYIISFAEQTPNTFTTPVGQTQIIVLKINSPTNYVKLLNLNGENDIFNLTADDIFNALCLQLLAPPTECVLSAINITG